jgi:hypothetical protein
MTEPTEYNMQYRLHIHKSNNTLLIDLSSMRVTTKQHVDIIFNAIRSSLQAHIKQMDVIVNYDDFYVADDVISHYGEHLTFFQDNIYKTVTRFTTRTIEQKQMEKLRKYMDDHKFGFELYTNTKIIDDKFMLKQHKVLGEGTFGKVFLGKCKDDETLVAIKRLSKRMMNQVRANDFVIRETAIARRLKHENIVNLIDAIETEHSIYIVMEYCNGGTLDIEYKQYSEKDARDIFVQLARAVKYVHDCGVIHRDIQLVSVCC